MESDLFTPHSAHFDRHSEIRNRSDLRSDTSLGIEAR